MRKTDEKREAILAAAYRLFREKGFERTSMSEVTALVGGSKATIYRYFPSKEQLFVDCILAASGRFLEGIHEGLDGAEGDPQVVLQEFGEGILRFLYSEEMMPTRRLVYAESSRSGFGELMLARVTSMKEHLVIFISRCMDAGALRAGAADLAAHQFVALLEAEVLDRFLFGTLNTPLDAVSIRRLVERAVRTFVRAYALEPARPARVDEARSVAGTVSGPVSSPETPR
jgi:AcrR family transcriptional regulator